MNYDAFARLNIVRKIIDNISPGIGQLGAIWPPFPHLLLLPFIWNDFLWHSGLAAAFVSTVSFVIGATFLEKTIFLITNSSKASLLAWLIFVTNQNILLFQTSPMSESFFLGCIILVIYFLTKWVKSQNTIFLVSAALFVMLGTLTRYEGYFILIGSLITVLSILLITYGKKDQDYVEGTFILFLTIASYGIVLWCVYCAIFFKDPFAWLNFYSKTSSGQPASEARAVLRGGYLQSFVTYLQASMWVSGIINSLVGILGYSALTIFLYLNLLKRRVHTMYLPLFIIGSVLFGSLIFGYKKGFIPFIMMPEINMLNIFEKSLNMYLDWGGPNIRYGLMMTPFLAMFAGLLAIRSKIIFIFLIILLSLQIYTNFYTPLFLQFSIAKASPYLELQPATWLRTHYDQGMVLIGSSRHEDLIFQTNLSYNNFIHEGTRHFWNEALDDPSKYVKWIVFNDLIKEDRLPSLLTRNAYEIIDTKFNLVYSDEKGYRIYKRI